MPKRQTIVIILAAMAVIYGLYNVFLTPSIDPDLKDTDGKTEISVKFATDLRKNMSKGGFSQNGVHILSRTSTDWAKDVFLTYRLPAQHKAESDQADAAAKPFNLSYSGYLETHNKRLAIINGREYEEGEELEEKGYVVRRILPARIMIGEKGKKKKFSVELEEIE